MCSLSFYSRNIVCSSQSNFIKCMYIDITCCNFPLTLGFVRGNNVLQLLPEQWQKNWPYPNTVFNIMLIFWPWLWGSQGPSTDFLKTDWTLTTHGNLLDWILGSCSNIYGASLRGIAFALKQKVIERGCIVNDTAKLPTNSNLMVTCWWRKMMQYAHKLKAVLQFSSSVLFNATLTFPFMLLL